MKLKPNFRFRARNLLDFLVVIGVVWLCTQLFPNDIKIADAGSLIVVSALYYILATLMMFIVFLVVSHLVNVTVGIVSGIFSAFIVGVPIMLLLKQFVNGFWIGDSVTALLISMVIALFVIILQSTIATIFRN